MEGKIFCIQCGEYIGKKEIKLCEKFPCSSSNLSVLYWLGLKLKNLKKLCKKTNEPIQDDRFL